MLVIPPESSSMKALAVPLPLTVIPISFFCTRSPSDLDCASECAAVGSRGMVTSATQADVCSCDTFGLHRPSRKLNR